MSDLARSFDDVAAAYDCGRPRYDDHAIAAIAAAAGGGPRLLDVGAGTGRLSGPLLEQGFDVVAVEPLDAMRAILAAAHRRRSRAGRPRRGAAAARRERRRRRLQRRLALVRRRPRRRRAGARRQAGRRRGRVRDVPALVRQRRRARLVARPRRRPRGAAQGRPPGYSSPARGGPTASRAIRPSRRCEMRDEPFVHAHRPRGHRRALGVDVVRRDAARPVSAPSFLGELDGMLARRGIDAGRDPLPGRAVDHSAAARLSALESPRAA